jgi:hypothetical protein
MTPQEYEAVAAAILARRSEDGDHRAAVLATAVAHRIDQRIRELDRDIAAARMRQTHGQRRRHLRVVA